MFEYKAKLLKIVDGDTVDLFVDLGFETWLRVRVRLMGIDTPERGEPGYAEAIQKVTEWFAERDNKCRTRTFINRNDKYGRYLAGIFHIENNEEISLNETLINSGFAKEYK